MKHRWLEIVFITPGPGANRARSRILTETGLNQLELGDVESASASLNEALTISRTLELRPLPERADMLVGLGRSLLARNRPADALPHLEDADGFWRTFDSESRWAGEASLWLGRTYAALGRDADAAAALSRARAILSRSAIRSDARLARLAEVRR